MARLPRANKILMNRIEFTEQVDRAQFTLNELSRAALLDTGRLIRKRMLKKAKQQPGMRRAKRPYNAFQYWVRRRETDLVVGTKHDTWYGAEQELGSNRQPKRSIIRSTVYENIDDIRRVQGQYLSAIEDDNRARGLIRSEEDGSDDTAGY